MAYIDGFGDSVFMELGATRVLECWGDDGKDGKRMICGGCTPIVELGH